MRGRDVHVDKIEVTASVKDKIRKFIKNGWRLGMIADTIGVGNSEVYTIAKEEFGIANPQPLTQYGRYI